MVFSCKFLLQSRGNGFVQSILSQNDQSNELVIHDPYDEELSRSSGDVVLDFDRMTISRSSSTQIEILSKKSKDSVEEESIHLKKGLKQLDSSFFLKYSSKFDFNFVIFNSLKIQIIFMKS